MKTCPKCGEKFPDDANFCPMDAQKLVPMAAPPVEAGPPGVINNRFALGKSLGGGPSGEVFQAKDQQGGATVAVKLIQSAVLPSPIAVERASRELRQLARVTSDRIARIIDFGKTQDGRLYVATELVAGEPLDRIVAREGALPLGRARGIALQIGEELTEAQKAGVIHRDVSPKNVLVGAGDKARVINFSVPRPVSDKIFGVPEFLSPEQAEGKSVDQRSNIYSLGAILYYLTVGKPPFEGDAKTVCQSHLTASVVPPSQRKSGLPAELDRLVTKALEKSSSRRHLTLRQLLSEIEALPADGAAPSIDQGRAHTMFAAGGIPNMQTLAAAPPPKATAPMAPAPAPVPVTPAAAPTAPTIMATPTVQAAPVAPPPPVQPVPRTTIAQAGTLGGTEPPKKTVTTAAPAPPPARPESIPQPVGKPGGGFRETLWFKKGEVDQVLQQAQQAQPGQPAPEAPAEDIRPIEDRYKDDGSVSQQDREKFSLKTGQTMFGQRIQLPTGAAVPGERMSEDEMMAEIHTGRRIGLWVAIAIGAIVLIAAGWFLFGRSRGDPRKSAVPAAEPAVATAPAPAPQPPAPVPPPPAPEPQPQTTPEPPKAAKKVDTKQIKALHAKAKRELKKKNWAAAKADYESILELAPGDKAAKAGLHEAEKKLRR